MEIGRYVRGLLPQDYRLSGSGPVRLVISFPRPRLSVLSKETESERGQRWLRALSELPVRHAALRLAAGPAGIIRVAEVPDPSSIPGFERFLSEAVARCGQSSREIEEAATWRRDEVERIAHGTERPALGNGAAERSGRKPPARTRPRSGEAVGLAASRSEIAVPLPGESSPPPIAAGTIAEDGSLA